VIYLKEDFDADFIKKTIENDLEILKNAGLAISLVSNEEVLFEEGFGFRNVIKKLPFTAKTLFPLGSYTKMITAHAIALLVDQGKMDWDTPIKDYIPTFKLKNQFATDNMNLVDLLSHATGLPHHQAMYMNTNWSYKQVFEKLPYLDFFAEFRGQFKYANLNYMIATKIVEDISEYDYFDFIKQQLFKPIGMKSTTFSVNEMKKTADNSLGYRLSESGFELEDYPDIKIQAAGAGSINSNLEDMNKWIQFLLNKGQVIDKQLISEKTLNKLYSIQREDKDPFAMIIPEQNYVKKYDFGLGCWIINYRGTPIIQHYGTGPGITFNGGFMPELNVGFVIFSNTSGSNMPFIANFHVADQMLGLDFVDWSSRIKEFSDKMAQTRSEKTIEAQDTQEVISQPSHHLDEFKGIYSHPGYGNIEFFIENDELKAYYGKNSDVDVTHYEFDTFTLVIKALGGSFKKHITFRYNFQGEITHLVMDAEPLVKPARFDKQKELTSK